MRLHDCLPPVVHRDITSKNILVDLEYEGYISDFGTARLLKPNSSNWTSVAGTVGYTASGSQSCFIMTSLSPLHMACMQYILMQCNTYSILYLHICMHVCILCECWYLKFVCFV